MGDANFSGVAINDIIMTTGLCSVMRLAGANLACRQ